jgi:hypothetical protein
MDKIINERFVKLSSRLPFPEDIQLGDDINLTFKGQNYVLNCVKSEDYDKQDGTIDRVFVLKYLGE